MKLEKWHWFIAALAIVIAVPLATAQEAPEEGEKKETPAAEKKAEGPELDEGAKKAWQGWKSKMYHLSNTALKKASFKISITIAHPMGEMKGTGTYVWDGSKGKMSWDDPMFGAQMSQGGDPAETYNRWFQKGALDKQFKGTKLTSKTEGDATVLSVDGKNDQGITEIHFDAAGVMSRIKVKSENPMAGEVTGTMDLAYTKVGDKYIASGQKGVFKTAMGDANMDIVITNEAKGDYHVPVKQTMERKMGGQVQFKLTMDFTDWKFDDDVE